MHNFSTVDARSAAAPNGLLKVWWLRFKKQRRRKSKKADPHL